MSRLDGFAHSGRVNAFLGWVSVGLLLFVVLSSVRSGAFLWVGFSGAILGVVVLPPLTSRDGSVMAPWPLVSISALAVLVGGFGLAPELAGYLAVATLALLAAVEIDAFTGVEMSRRFAVAFAVLTTLAVQGLWIIVQYASDLFVGTAFLTSQNELQMDIVLVSSIGLVMGIAAEWYFARLEPIGSYRRPTPGPPPDVVR